MYEQIDGILACRDLRSVRCATSRSVFGTSTCASVPLLGPSVAQLRPHVPQLGPSRPILSPKTVLWAKLTQAYGQHRSTSLCNFCMLM